MACDNYQGGVLAAKELLDSGCKEPLLFGNRIISDHLPAARRYQGFIETCRHAGLTLHEYYIDAEDLFGKYLEDDILRAKALFPQTDGLFVTSDVLAASIQTVLWRLVPDWAGKLPLVGFDGVSVFRLLPDQHRCPAHPSDGGDGREKADLLNQWGRGGGKLYPAGFLHSPEQLRPPQALWAVSGASHKKHPCVPGGENRGVFAGKEGKTLPL